MNITKFLLITAGASLFAAAIFSACEINKESKACPSTPEQIECTGDIIISDHFVSGGEYKRGDEVAFKLTILNDTLESGTFWAGCSIRDPLGHYYDLPSIAVTLDSKQSTDISFNWQIPLEEDKADLSSGPYTKVMALWSDKPGEIGAEKLDSVETNAAFEVIRHHEDFTVFSEELWRRSSHQLGRSNLEPGNVTINNEQLEITLPAGTLDGGQIESREYDHLYGSYQVRMKLPEAPSSITGFFLYRQPDYYHEIDIEIVNDCSGTIWFTTYADGSVSSHHEKILDFNPTEEFHEYRFDYYPGEVSFYVDGELLKTFKEGLTDQPMKLMINSWFPDWLDGIKPQQDAVTRIDWIKY